MRTYSGIDPVTCSGLGDMEFTCCECKRTLQVPVGRAVRVPAGHDGYDFCCLDCAPQRLDVTRLEEEIGAAAQDKNQPRVEFLGW